MQTCPRKGLQTKEMDRLLSVVVSVYNEEKALEDFYREATGVLKGIAWEYELIFVNDGSGDQSLSILERLAAGEQLEDAVKQAVDICMKEGVLADILRTQRAEEEELMWAEFNEERFIAKEKEYSWEDGNKAGKVKGRAESILEILEELGTVPEELRRRLLEETDLQRLKNWLKEAIKAASIEDFAENMDK